MFIGSFSKDKWARMFIGSFSKDNWVSMFIGSISKNKKGEHVYWAFF